ncbi:succinate dehydrogenase, cytochrome b556 subunit [Roseibium limicola]|uniref:Succinate dehydrogenase cytochrome b556 subunit n=1 Tax=Roseibium limicola TaxID=2816037 RepID=A0A939JAH9_9HYPH|nr:succinate dehydrogenase, cytochrome b556 subunit [Roseibium limicola]MBO0346448.1 succinate dehydrogenase, cytochrome b556 subunit [Roseibium limicola]
MSNADLRGNRPLSPHLQIYKPILTMVVSIVHRITGAALYFGTILLAWWLIAAAAGPEYFEFVNAIYGSIIGQLILFGFTWALVHHMLSGVRHLIWSLGKGFELKFAEWMARITIISSVSLTILLWIIGYLVR